MKTKAHMKTVLVNDGDQMRLILVYIDRNNNVHRLATAFSYVRSLESYTSAKAAK